MKKFLKTGVGRLGLLFLLLLVVALSAWGFSGLSNQLAQSTNDSERLRTIDSEHVSPETWRSIQLAMHKADGSKVSINLLRPLWWLSEADAQVGGTIFLSMPEMGIEGDAEVLEIGPCTVSADAGVPGRQVVTGTFCHQNAVVLDLYFDASPEPLSATASHPFWSASREDWVEAGELELGEYVATRDGIVQLIRRAQRPGLHKVYNIEVHQTHNYYVSNLGILVHNGCEVSHKIPRDKLRKPKKRGNAPIGEDGHPVELHHNDQSLGNKSPRSEMTRTEHRGEGNYKKNHENTGQKPSTVDRAEARAEHREYWTEQYDSGEFDNLPE